MAGWIGGEIISAGFVRIGPDGNLKCSGLSDTLRMGPLPGDDKLIQAQGLLV